MDLSLLTQKDIDFLNNTSEELKEHTYNFMVSYRKEEKDRDTFVNNLRQQVIDTWKQLPDVIVNYSFTKK